MTAILHDPLCKQHGFPFPHRVITSTTVTPNRKGERYRIVTETIVCAFCGHWIARRMERCRCPASCHMEARNRESIGVTVVRTPITD